MHDGQIMITQARLLLYQMGQKIHQKLCKMCTYYQFGCTDLSRRLLTSKPLNTLMKGHLGHLAEKS